MSGDPRIGRDDPGTGEPTDESRAGEGSQTPGKRVVRRRPEQTADDTDAGWGERADESAHDRWLREQRPPHWE